MTSHDSASEFRRGPQLRVQMELTREQHAAMKEWSASVPTLYFLDICVVNIAKRSAEAFEGDARKASIASCLRDLDRPQNSFSYLLALIEKTSDSQSHLSDAELERQVLIDVTALKAFFKHARVAEPDAFLTGYLGELRRVPHELSRPNYLRFLQAANDRFALKDPVAPPLRLRRAKELLDEADSTSVPRQHPVVLVTLACLYGNRSAKKLMKFRAEPNAFNAENALADIMVISRFAPLKLEIEQKGRSEGGPFARSLFITDDDGLSGILPCFEAQAVRSEVGAGTSQTRIDMTVHLQLLLTDLGAGGQAASAMTLGNPDQGPNEFEQLCALLTQ